MKKQIVFFAALFFLSVSIANAQEKKYTGVDAYAAALGTLNNLNVATIADTLTRPFVDKRDKARAIFYWIANNIEIDLKATKSHDNKKSDPVDVIQLRKATATGFALLVQEMCSMANIRCLTADGYVKQHAEDINNKADEINHTWNVVQLGQSPDEWHYIDAAKASGYTDRKLSSFTKQFTSEYFFADRILFNLDHFPDNAAWQLGPGPKGFKEFYSLPVIKNAAYTFGLRKPQPVNGHIKVKTNSPVNFNFTHNSSVPVQKIVMLMGSEKKQWKSDAIQFGDSGGTISFIYKFKVADSYPVRILIDEKEVLEYYVEAED